MKFRHCILLGAVIIVSGCASDKYVYNPPPPPSTFSLHMRSQNGHEYVIHGKSYAFMQAEAYLKQEVSNGPRPYTVLLDHADDLKVPAYLCYVVLMHESGAVGYYAVDGKPKSLKITFNGGHGPGDFPHQIRKCAAK